MVLYAELCWQLSQTRITLKAAMAYCHRLQDINTLHQKLGHASKALMQKMQNFTAGNSKVSLKFVRAVHPTKFHQKDTNKEKKVVGQVARQVAVYQHQPCQKLKLQRLAVLATHCWQSNGFQFQVILENKGSDVAGHDFAYTGAAQLRKQCCKKDQMSQLGRECCLSGHSKERRSGPPF